MAPPKRNTRGCHGKERRIVPCCSHRQPRKRPTRPRRAQAHRPINVPELVYRLLNPSKPNQVAQLYETTRRGRGGKVLSSKGGSYGKMRKYQKPRESSCDTASFRESSTSIDESEYTKSVATSMDNLSRMMEATNSSVTAVSENSSRSNICVVEPITLPKSINNTRALLKKKSLVQIINNYIRAGIEEGKRQAKKYIRKALSFGVKSGYLIPADPHGQVIRVSPTLVESRRSDAESRRKRRRARRGEEDDSYVERKERLRETPPPASKKKPRREVSPEPAPPRKRRKTSTSKTSRMNLSLAGTSGQKNSKAQSRQKGNRKKSTPTTKKREKVLYYNLSASAKRSDESIKKGKEEEGRRRNSRVKHRDEVTEKRQSRRRRASKSPSSARKNGKDNTRKSNRDSSDENGDSTKSSDNEVNQRAVTERRKSASICREILPREDNDLPENPAREMEETLQSPNILESNNDSMIQNVD